MNVMTDLSPWFVCECDRRCENSLVRLFMTIRSLSNVLGTVRYDQLSLWRMGPSMKDSGFGARKPARVQVFKSGPTALCMRATGKIIRPMARAD